MGKRKNPFTPGMGRPPPVRAGHKEAVRVLDSKLGGVLEKDPGDMIVLYGPRGNGKTTLLLELEQKARDGDATVRKRTANRIRSAGEGVAKDLVSDGGTQLDLAASFEADIGFVKGKFTVKPDRSHMIEVALRVLAKSRPTVLLIDEAHNLPAGLGSDLLNAIQVCMGERLPLLMVLAGTPVLEEKLGEMDASFWERCLSLRIGRIESVEDVRNALVIPARQSGLPFADDALDLLVDESQGYPFFVQMLGAAAWEAAERSGNDGITVNDAKAGLGESEPVRLAFYLRRRNEIEKSRVLPEAEAVSRAVLQKGSDAALTDGELKGVLRETLGSDLDAVLSAKAALSNLGLIWQTPHNTWEPGIPSLCSYIVAESEKG